MVLRRWGSDARKFGLSTELITLTDHRTEIEKADVSSVSPPSAQIDELIHETSAFSISVRWSIYIINSVDKPNFRAPLNNSGFALKLFISMEIITPSSF